MSFLSSRCVSASNRSHDDRASCLNGLTGPPPLLLLLAPAELGAALFPAFTVDDGLFFGLLALLALPALLALLAPALELTAALALDAALDLPLPFLPCGVAVGG